MSTYKVVPLAEQFHNTVPEISTVTPGFSKEGCIEAPEPRDCINTPSIRSRLEAFIRGIPSPLEYRLRISIQFRKLQAEPQQAGCERETSTDPAQGFRLSILDQTSDCSKLPFFFPLFFLSPPPFFFFIFYHLRRLQSNHTICGCRVCRNEAHRTSVCMDGYVSNLTTTSNPAARLRTSGTKV